MKHIIGPIIDAMKIKGRPGALPIVRHCPYCHAAMSVGDMAKHMPACKRDFRDVPPQEITLDLDPPVPSPLPDDLDNQDPSMVPSQSLRQAEQREQERIQRG